MHPFNGASMKDNSEGTAEACRNCGDGSPGRFCPACGQRKGDVRVSLRRMLADVLEDQLSIDSTLPRTLVAILFRPGHLTNEYLAGRIASWIPPFRLYLAASVLFFLALSIGNRTGELRTLVTANGDTIATVGPESGMPVSAAIDSLRSALGDRPADTARGVVGAAGDTADGADDQSMEEPGGRLRVFGLSIDSEPGDDRPWTERVDANTGNAALDRFIESRFEAMSGLPADEVVKRILAETLNKIPTAMFVLLPLFALLLKGLYFRTGKYYVEHFVFSLHYHAFAFLTFTLMLVLGSTPVAPVLGLWQVVYLWLALRRVYGQGALWTSFKWVALTWAYSIVLGIGLFLTLIVAVILL